MYRKFIIFISLIAGLCLPTHGQRPSLNRIFQSDYGRAVLVGSLRGGYCQYLSGDARYIAGTLGGAAGFIYDLEKDSVHIFNYTVPACVSPEQYAGQNDPNGICNAFVHFDGQNFPIERICHSGKRAWDDISIWAYQSTGDRVVGMGYESVFNADKTDSLHINIAAVFNGKTGELERLLRPYWPMHPTFRHSGNIGYGSRGDCISDDGTVVGGHGTNPNEKLNWSLTFWDISDPDTTYTFALEGKDYSFGTFHGINRDGSVLVGQSENLGIGLIVYYNKTQKTFSHENIQALPGWDFLDFTGVTDDNLIVGYCGMAADPGTRLPIVYTRLTGVLPLTEFIYEYYDVNIGKLNLYTPMAIRQQGDKYVAGGFLYDEMGGTQVWFIEFGRERILPRARKVLARAGRSTPQVQITWQAPLVSANHLQGFNVYRNDETTPLNDSPLSRETDVFNDETVMPGEHIYHVEAIYEEGYAFKAPANPVLVVDEGEIFPVHRIGHHLTYNRYASVYWGVSSSQMTDAEPTAAAMAKADRKPVVKGIPDLMDEDEDKAMTVPALADRISAQTPKNSHDNPQLDYIANVDMRMYSGYVGIKIGEDYYVSSHLDGGIRVLDRNNEIKKVIAPNGLGIVLSMVYIAGKNLLYCGSASDVKVLDLNRPDSIVDLFKTEAGARHMAYIPELNDGRGGLALGDHHSCLLYDLEGHKLGSSGLDFSRLHVSGTAYYNGKLYVASQTGPYLNEIHTFDFETKQAIGDPIQVNEDPALYNLLSLDGELPSLEKTAYAAGLTICPMEDEAVALGAVFQCAYLTSRLMLLELKAPDNVKGYNLYRNGVKINGSPLTSRRYREEFPEPGVYVYHVTTVSETGKESEPSPKNTIVVTDRRPCPAPETFTAMESNRMPVLSWMPADDEEALVGFNLYRDETLIERFWEDKLRLSYIDGAVQAPGTYTYRLESFYASGCLASDTAAITLTGEGKMMPPFGLQVSAEKQADRMTATARWESPMFEEPLALRYGSGLPTDLLNIDGFYEYWAAIGWDTTNLALYKDLYLVGLEFFVGNTVTKLDGLVIVNDKLVYEKNAGRVIPKEWQTLYFDQSFPMDQVHEIAVGYHAKYATSTTGVMVVDAYYSKSGYSDLISLDGTTWSTLKAGGFSGTWSIAALAVHKRDLEDAVTDGRIDYEKLKGHTIRVGSSPIAPITARSLETDAMATTARMSAKTPLTLKGFNVYRRSAEDEAGSDREIKLNGSLLQSFQFEDTGVEPGEYIYAVSAVYGNDEEMRAERYIEFLNLQPSANGLNLSIHPNPASETVHIDGTYETLQVADINGRPLKTFTACPQVPVGDLTPGVYFFRFSDKQSKAVYKVVIR